MVQIYAFYIKRNGPLTPFNSFNSFNSFKSCTFAADFSELHIINIEKRHG